MSSKKIVTLAGFIVSIIITALIAFAEEPVAATADSASLSSDQQVAPKSINETQWAWGEVTNLDAQAKTFTLKYLDYETDQEKDLVLAVDEKTTFENIKSFDEIKIKDTLSVDYMVAPDGKNVAKNINFEKPDVSPVVENSKPVEMAEQPAGDTSIPLAVPEAVQPTVQPETIAESSSPASEVPAQPADSTAAPAGQEGQAQ